MNEFLSIGLIGAIMSLVIEVIKRKYGLNSVLSRTITIILAVSIGTAYFFLSQSSWFTSVLGVLAAASTVYNFLIPKEKSLNSDRMLDEVSEM